MKKIAFVIPWYGDDIRGGAEAECNKLAHCFAASGLAVEVFTTCVKQASDDRGKNSLQSGDFIESGILVRRFKVRKRNADRFNAANYKLYHNQSTTLTDEIAYFEEDINSPDMYHYIAKHQNEYEFFIFMPYLYGIIYHGMKICPNKSIMIPCFHDESYAYMSLVKDMTESAKGLIFLSTPEYELAERLYDLSNVKTAVLGALVDSGWEEQCSPESFKDKYNIHEDFILCAGRKDAGKKVEELVDFFCLYKKKNPERVLKLVLIGGGEIDIPDNHRNDIIDLGFVSSEDKHNALAASLLLCNPSYFESFSIVIMESWLAKRPVLVSEHCAVTSNFCKETNGGLYYNTVDEFCACINYILDHRDISDCMGENGFCYVKENFVASSILKKYYKFFNEFKCDD